VVRNINYHSLLIQSFFVPDIQNETDPDKILNKWDIRQKRLQSIIREQFELSYFGTIDYGVTGSMTIAEREILYNIFIEQKKKEAMKRNNS
jgi:hypothetical protein